MALVEFRDALRMAMTEEMERDENVFLMGEEVAEYNGAYKVSRGMLERFGPGRVLDTPISEAAFAGIGVGAAMCGLRPIVEFMSWSFSLVAIDQIINNAANVRYMSGGQFKVPIVFRGGNGIARGLAATHSHRLDSVYSRIPGLIVVAPSDPYDAKGLLKTSIRCDDPVIFLESEIMLSDKGEVPEHEYTLPLGKAHVRRGGDDVTLICWSKMVKLCMQAAEQLEADGVSAEVIDLRTLRPLDLETLAASVAKTHRCVVVDEDWPYCGMGAGVIERLYPRVFDDLDAPIARVCAEDVPSPYSQALEIPMQPSVEKVVKAVRETCYV